MGPIGFQSRSLLCGKLLDQVVVENWDVKSVWRNDAVDCWDYIASNLGERNVLMDRRWSNTGWENRSTRIKIPIPMPLYPPKSHKDWSEIELCPRRQRGHFCVCTYVRIYLCIHACTYVRICVCMHVCMYVCVYVYVCMYVYMHVWCIVYVRMNM